MTILYCVICRRDTVLAKYAARVGNFSEISDLVIARIPPEDGKMTYRWGSIDLIIANIPEEDVRTLTCTAELAICLDTDLENGKNT